MLKKKISLSLIAANILNISKEHRKYQISVLIKRVKAIEALFKISLIGANIMNISQKHRIRVLS